jgi:hypothetical protein
MYSHYDTQIDGAWPGNVANCTALQARPIHSLAMARPAGATYIESSTSVSKPGTTGTWASTPTDTRVMTVPVLRGRRESPQPAPGRHWH